MTSTPDAAQPRQPFFTRQTLAVIATIVVAALVAGLIAWWAWSRIGSTKVTATFNSSVGMYEGSNVRILGVDVGKVTKVTPRGETVDVEMRVDRGIKLPADVQAVQIIPSLVADRYVQLLPAYNGGPTTQGDVNLGLDRTAVPVEIDAIYGNLQKLSKSLGPGKDGVNQKGALSNFVTAGAKALDGHGETMGSAITNLSKAAETLANSSGDISTTVKNLNVFVGALRENDSQVRLFNSQMASFNGFLSGEREQLGKALDTLSFALGDVATFIADNQAQIGETIRDLQPTGQALLDNKDSLLEIMTVLPLAVSNLINAYDAESGTVAMRVNIPDLQNPTAAVCKMLDLGALLPGNPLAVDFSNKLRPLVDHCLELGEQIQNDVLEPLLPILPFGLMSNRKLQNMLPPGSVPGVPDTQLPPYNKSRGGN
ncbi:MAG: MCE family protein [Gordonia sp. (in: high G+C Gram-positive bacteria)]|uniref:MCE family protein n=1 Tax=Gordonia sp. (in: high G+C Gram-positive bacteria) TaxID=84139 RepID=UPI003BB4B0C7